MDHPELFKPERASLAPELAEKLRGVPRALRAAVLSAAAPVRPGLVSFAARFRTGGDGLRILAVYVRNARRDVADNPAVKLASDRFGHGVPYSERVEVDNSAIPLFVAAVACAAPELAGNVKVRTRAAAVLRKSGWRPVLS